MSEKIKFSNLLDGSLYGAIVSQINQEFSKEISTAADALVANTEVRLPDYGEPKISSMINSLWNNEDLKLPEIFASPEMKRILIADTYMQYVDAAHSGCSFYEMFSKKSQDILSDFTKQLGPCSQAFSDKVSEVLTHLMPRSYGYEYEYVAAFALMLCMLPIVGMAEFVPLGRMGGIRSEVRTLSQMPELTAFVNSVRDTYRLSDGEDFFPYYLQNIQIGVPYRISCNVDSANSRATAFDAQNPPIVQYILEHFPPKVIIHISTILCPLLFCEHIFTRLHILCRLLWSPLDIYPDRFMHSWLPAGYVDVLSKYDSDIKRQSVMLELPRVFKETRVKQLTEILHKLDKISVMDLSPGVTKLLKFKIFSAILHPALVQSAYNQAALRKLKGDVELRKQVGNSLYSTFREKFLSDTKGRAALLDGDLESVSYDKTDDTLRKLLDVKDALILQLFITAH